MDKDFLVAKLKSVANDLQSATEEIISGGINNIGYYTEDGKHVRMGNFVTPKN